MTKKSSFTLAKACLFVASVFFSGVAAEAAGPPKAYDIVTENSGPGGSSTTHSWSDGKGHLRSETTVAGTKSVTIMDFNAKVSYIISDAQKTITKVPMNAAANAAAEDKTKWTNLGNKVIDGHPCEGKKMVSTSGPIETWTGTDTGCTVLMTTNGKPTMKLKSWSGAAPAASMFALPSGYKTMDMAALMKGMGGK